MVREYEVQVLDVNVDAVKKQLKSLGGKQVHKNTKLIRTAFELCNPKTPGFARVRSDGKTTTMTVKVYDDKNFPEETEVIIKENYEVGKKFLLALGLKQIAFQETYREKWSLPIKGVIEVVFDTWPGLPTWMEIECTTEKILNAVVKKMGISQDQIDLALSAGKYELYYGITNKDLDENVPNLTFKDIHNVKPKKNKELFNKIVKLHQKKYVN
jgi:adenylate cyclase class 2